MKNSPVTLLFGFKQIHLIIFTNTFNTFDKYMLQFGQIHLFNLNKSDGKISDMKNSPVTLLLIIRI